MPALSLYQRLAVAAVLIMLLALTRGQHALLPDVGVPDASLALFFLAGFYFRALWVFPGLFALTTLIDLAAVTWGGVSAFCITPAYLWLIPAYGVLWGAGRWLSLAPTSLPGWLGRLRFVTLVVAAAALSELFSTGGFYLYSGRFFEPQAIDALARWWQYLPQTLSALALYLGLAWLIHQLATALAHHPQSDAHGQLARSGTGLMDR